MVSERYLADEYKTKEQLLSELANLRQRVSELSQAHEQSQAQYQSAELQSPSSKFAESDVYSSFDWRISLLQRLTADLAGALTTAEIFEILLRQGLVAFNATRGWVAQRVKKLQSEYGFESDSEIVEITQTLGFKEVNLNSYRQIELSQSTPATDVIRTGKVVLVPSQQEFQQRYPDLFEQFHALGSQSLVALPLVIKGQVIGSLGWSFASPQVFDSTTLDFMMTLARQCAQALERAYLYEAERLARETAEAANRVKDEFLAVLSHELRSPLNPILGWTKMLRSHQFDVRMTNRALEAIERNAKLQVQLIEDLLDVSHILQGKLRLNRATVDLTTVIEAALESIRLAAESKSIKLRFQPAHELPSLDGSAQSALGSTLRVVGDANRLQQIVWNLVSNAVKFTPIGGQVDISLKFVVAPAQNSQLQLASPSNQPTNCPPLDTRYAEISVADTGQGIDPDFLPYIFDYFRQADSTITRQFGGLGLGLTIVRHLVELHGGTIQVESDGKDQGAVFRVRLPLLQLNQYEPVAAPSVPEPMNLPLLSQARILVVDHHADMREYVDAVLRAAGVKVALAGSAGEALAKLSRFKPDLLISDIGLPNVDGYMLLRQIRSLVPELGSQIPAIALTGYAGEYDQQQILAAGFQAHISKPIEPQALITAVARLLSAQDAGDRT